MTDHKQALADKSNKLLDALRRLRATEEAKREVPISTPIFHALANDVDDISREIYRTARDQNRLSDQIPMGTDTIEDVNRSGSEGST